MADEPEDEHLTPYEEWVEYFAHHYRWIPVVFFLLPLSFLNDLKINLQNKIVHFLQSAPREHPKKVAKIQKEVAEWHAGDKTKKMCNARSGWSTMSFRYPSYKDKSVLISTNTLVDILELDTNAMTVRVQPMVTMGQLTRFLIPRGYTLPIVPELDDLTVGGMINGCGVEASGLKYGMFQHICVSYELVMADGSLVTASCDGNEDEVKLFHGVPWSHGTLGFLVAATIRVVKSKPYVKLTYTSTKTAEDTQAKLTEEADRTDIDFLEGLQYNLQKGVIMTGVLTDAPTDGSPVNAIGRWHKQWFYTHADQVTNEHKTFTEYIPVRDYYHRHSKSIFWELEEIVPFGNHVLFRWLMGWMCPPKIAFLKKITTSVLRKLYNRKHVLQDMLIPIDKTAEAIRLFHDEIQIYPLWLCPYRQPSMPGMVSQTAGHDVMYIDIGAYGVTKKDTYHAERTTRVLEEYVRSVNGWQMMYADTYMNEGEFWQMFDGTLYEHLRAKYSCKDAFASVYHKVCKANRY